MSLLFFALAVPTWIVLFLVAFVVNKVCDKVERILQRIDAIELEDEWDGRIVWPVDLDESILENLRLEAGDEDDRRRQQFDAIALMDTRRH